MHRSVSFTEDSRWSAIEIFIWRDGNKSSRISLFNHIVCPCKHFQCETCFFFSLNEICFKILSFWFLNLCQNSVGTQSQCLVDIQTWLLYRLEHWFWDELTSSLGQVKKKKLVFSVRIFEKEGGSGFILKCYS